MTPRLARQLATVATVASIGLGVPTAAAAAVDQTPPAPFDIVADAGDFQTGYSVASPYNNIYVTWAETTDDSSAVNYEVSVDGVLARSVPGDVYATITKRIDVPDGQHVVTVAAFDSAGNRRDATHSLDVLIDSVSPVFTSFPLLLLRLGPVTPSAYPLRYRWTGSDEGTGLASGHIGPNDSCCYTFDPMLPYYDFSVAPKSTDAWRLALFDGVGRMVRTHRDGYVSALPWSATVHSGSWHKADRASSFSGAEWRTKKQGDRFSFKVDGRSVAWVSRTGPTMGKADVLVNGRLARRVDLYAKQTHDSHVVWTMKLPRQTTKVTIVNRSTGDHRVLSVEGVLLQR